MSDPLILSHMPASDEREGEKERKREREREKGSERERERKGIERQGAKL